jgi:hypothetical protein
MSRADCGRNVTAREFDYSNLVIVGHGHRMKRSLNAPVEMSVRVEQLDEATECMVGDVGGRLTVPKVLNVIMKLSGANRGAVGVSGLA